MEHKGFQEDTIVDKLRYLRKLPRVVAPEMVMDGIPFNSHVKQTLHYVARYLFETGRLGLEDWIRWRELLNQALRERNRRLRSRRSRGAREVGEDEVVAVLRRVKDTEYFVVGKILLASGIRGSEAAKLVREYDPGKLEFYGETVLYRMKWYRGYKACEYVFMPKALHGELESIAGSSSITKKKLERMLRPVSIFRDFLYQRLKDMGYRDEAAFIESRELPVSEEHYDKIKQRAIKAYREKWIPYIENILSRL